MDNHTIRLVWFRNDLRLHDNPALYQATQQAESVSAIYCITPEQWKKHDEAPVKLGFRSKALESLQKGLATLGIPLTLIEANDFSDLPEQILKYCQQHQIGSVFFNREIPIDEKRRDQEVFKKLNANNIECHTFEADLLIDPDGLLNKQGLPFKVFTPWYKAWLSQLANHPFTQSLPAPAAIAPHLPDSSDPIRLPVSSDFRSDLWPATEAAALQKLSQFTQLRMRAYLNQRDFPSINGTSTLSPYFASGLLSARQCLQALQQQHGLAGNDWIECGWLRELAWREFYRYLMHHFPRLGRGEAFKPETEQLAWQPLSPLVEAWQRGETGFPIVDAAMKQLIQTGWMHNRLRMVTASFFCKLLGVHWRHGEQFFMRHLIDGDFPSNNGGWQWSSSSGCDASPWFRIFNPTTQSQKFDADGVFIKRFLPELEAIPAKQIHNPSSEQRRVAGYPEPIIDYSEARRWALDQLNSPLSKPI